MKDGSSLSHQISFLRKMIESQGFVRSSEMRIVKNQKIVGPTNWLFDVKAILMRADVMKAAADVFWAKFKSSRKVQIGCIETAGIPIMAALVATARNYKQEATGFFIRKSRKREGRMKMIEGEFRPELPVILVDDVLNTGSHFVRQVEVVESQGGKVAAVWAFVRFRDKEYYEYFRKKNIEVHSVFTLDDFAETLGTKNLDTKEHPPRQMPTVIWKFASPDPSFHYVNPKSEPVLDDERVYFGADNGTMWALNQSDGSVAWSYRIGLSPKDKGIFSSPALSKGILYFGGYDGNVHAVDAKTGKKIWTYWDADWVGSSPTVSEDLGFVFVGLEFGLWRKRGGIVALNAQTGKKIWDYVMPCYTHSSPLYIESHGQVVIGSNDGATYLFDAKDGKLCWKFQPFEISEKELNSGFSRFAIKESLAYDEKRDLVIVCNLRGDVFFLDKKTGSERGRFTLDVGFFSTPVIYKDTVLAASLDKNLYSINLDSFQEKWRWNAGARIFATPLVIDDTIYLGSNAGRFTEIDAITGKERTFVTLTERITNKTAYNPQTKMFFVPTFANEVYCIEREAAATECP